MIATLLLAVSVAIPASFPDMTCRVRDTRGQVVRSRARRSLFLRVTGYPKGRPGYVVDHWIPLACGGCDTPSNMQWLTVAEWKRKTGWERKPCSAWFDGTNERLLQRGMDAR